MFKYSYREIASISEKSNFITSVVEKELRLIEILRYIDRSNIADKLVLKEIKEMFVLDENDLKFIELLNDKQFEPNVLFEGCDVEDVSLHPMGIWKTR